jgi:hypothetical protein
MMPYPVCYLFLTEGISRPPTYNIYLNFCKICAQVQEMGTLKAIQVDKKIFTIDQVQD